MLDVDRKKVHSESFRTSKEEEVLQYIEMFFSLALFAYLIQGDVAGFFTLLYHFSNVSQKLNEIKKKFTA